MHTYTYDKVGNRLTQASSAGTFISTFDARNHEVSLAEPGGKTALYAYDPASRRVSMEAYGKGTFTYAYDSANQQTQVITPQLQTTTIVYDAVGRITQRQFASGTRRPRASMRRGT